MRHFVGDPTVKVRARRLQQQDVDAPDAPGAAGAVAVVEQLAARR